MKHELTIYRSFGNFLANAHVTSRHRDKNDEIGGKIFKKYDHLTFSTRKKIRNIKTFEVTNVEKKN